ncbi:hypothetical protein Pmani_008881 [Petrolisthes manimaculis]|uniref:Uncharacterized protein n=1 Tax=Petrolisthes manimaculis TaxID=1843537 RepID=A0AAE1Q653_9EUCA|nr:hypothetical protein Pmani_008881 [Petrolisthes manimaculis]
MAVVREGTACGHLSYVCVFLSTCKALRVGRDRGRRGTLVPAKDLLISSRVVVLAIHACASRRNPPSQQSKKDTDKDGNHVAKLNMEEAW